MFLIALILRHPGLGNGKTGMGFETSVEEVEVRVELWCSDASFRFISEGTQRFGQMRMSPQPEGSSRHRSMFSLKGTGDPRFPHRFQVRLPRWSLRDVDLRRWIVGWGGEVKNGKRRRGKRSQ